MVTKIKKNFFFKYACLVCGALFLNFNFTRSAQTLIFESQRFINTLQLYDQKGYEKIVNSANLRFTLTQFLIKSTGKISELYLKSC